MNSGSLGQGSYMQDDQGRTYRRGEVYWVKQARGASFALFEWLAWLLLPKQTLFVTPSVTQRYE